MSTVRHRRSPDARRLPARPLVGLACVLACLLELLLPRHAVARPLDDVKSSKVLHVIVYEDNAPYSWTDGDGKVQGIDADIARAVAERLGVEANVIARAAGEEVDDDLRSNIWQGPRTGGLKGDVMMHVPMEKEFIARNNLVAISNAYHHEKVVLFVHPDMVDVNAGLSAFRNAKLAVQFATSAHYYVMFADDEVYKANINPYRKLSDVVASFLDRRNAGIIGARTELEAALASHRASVRMLEPAFKTHLRMSWTIGTAVKEDSRDTGYAFGNALRALEADGGLDRIFASYHASRVAPPVP